MAKTKKRRKRKRGYTSLAKKNQRDIKFLKKGIELKTALVSGSNSDVNTTGAPIYLTPISQGNTEHTRVGNQILVRKIKIRALFHNDHGTAADAVVRVIVLRKKKNAGVAPVLADLLTPTTVLGFYPLKESNNQVIYFDQTFIMDKDLQTNYVWKYSKKLNTEVTFNNTGSSSSHCEDQGFYLFVLSNIAGTTDDPLLDYSFRVSFIDN